MADTPRAAIIGASGIGKHHAKWLAKLGCEVCAIVGTSQASVAKASQGLADLFGFAGKGYTDILAMLEAEDPDLVNVCTPPELHGEHVMLLAPRRCHVLCEKPLTWDEGKSPEQFLAEAREMVAACERPGRVTAINLQYSGTPPAYLDLCRQLGGTMEPPTSFFMHMDSRRERNRYEIIWRELGPHTLSVMTAFCGPGTLVDDSVTMKMYERRCEARFRYRPDEGPECECEIVTGNVPEGPLTRRFGINGLLADYEGRNDEKGVFSTYLTIEGKEHKSDDLMYLSMARLVGAVTGQAPRPLATMAEGLANEEMQLRILARGERL